MLKVTISGSDVTHTDIAQAIAKAHSWRGALRLLGLPEASASAMRIVKRFASDHDIPCDHFTGVRRWSDQKIREATPEARTWAELLRMLGMKSDTGENRASVRAHTLRLGLDISHLEAPTYAAPADTSVPQLAHLRSAAEALAQAWFELRGIPVAKPTTASQVYDMLVELDGRFQRVQVKTTTTRDSQGSWLVVTSRRTPGATKNGPRVPYRLDDVDLFFIIDGDMMVYLIPSIAVSGKLHICLSAYMSYQVGSFSSPLK
ncbi:group I intron-associated PD-(D/E)XK endonuclease [Streptosporangium sp. NPDC050855]|uniref:group I intron-associated PD-(D/E)XK endonuclease n=1 Tax=Streptosporangium sp. NPDC050855 TaxID=3366194 RepID=UPI0037962C17